jgi:hypothetical protein
MRQVSVVRIARRKIATTVLGMLVATVAVQGMAIAGQQTPEIAVRTLGGPNRFSGPMRGVEDLRAMATTNRTQISSALGQAGVGEISTQVLNVLTTGDISDTTVAPGTHFDWMALKRSGRPGVLRNVRWTGRSAFDAFQFSVEYAGYNYTFVVPKICGNFALLSKTASPVAIAEPPRRAPAPEPPPPPPPPPEPAPVVEAPPPPPPAPVVVVEEKPLPHWIATGFIGSSFSASGDLPVQSDTGDGGITYGFNVLKMWGYAGAEVLADFAPTFKMASLALSDHPSVNSYMLNLIIKAPFGSEGQFEPYISGGLGWLTMSTTTFTVIGNTIQTASLATVNDTQSKFGTDIGGGFFIFPSKWGIRADVRHYRASTFDAEKLQNGTFANDFTQSLVSGLTFWRANLGVAYRW